MSDESDESSESSSISNNEKLRGETSLYRTAGIVGSIFSMVQTSIWIILCLVGIIYFIIGAPYSSDYQSSTKRYGYVLSQIYFNRYSKFISCASLTASVFFVLNWIYMFLSIHLLAASKIAFCEQRSWKNALLIRERTMYWIIASCLMIGYETFLGTLFIEDYATCLKDDESDTAAAALTMATIALKGFLMWFFNLTIVTTVLIAHFVKCPVKLT